MKRVKVISINSDQVVFNDETKLFSCHMRECCENHWLCLDDLNMSDFEGLEFDLSNENFFKKIEGYGIELLPIKGHSVKIAGHGSNNGYYSSELTLCISNGDYFKEYDITQCQVIND
jgi:hypothetical protein